MPWPPGYAVICCARVGDPYWRTTGRPEVTKQCRNCKHDVMVESDLIERANQTFGSHWDFACVECYSTNRAPIEIWNH